MGQVDKDAMVEGVKNWYEENNRGLPLGQAVSKWAEHFEVSKDTVKKHLRECDRLKPNTTHIYLNKKR